MFWRGFISKIGLKLVCHDPLARGTFFLVQSAYFVIYQVRSQATLFLASCSRSRKLSALTPLLEYKKVHQSEITVSECRFRYSYYREREVIAEN